MSLGTESLAVTISTVDELEIALRHEQLVLHFDVDWSVQAHQSRSVVAEFREYLQSNPQSQSVAFHRVDCSEQSGPVWDAIQKLLEQQGVDLILLYGGGGAIAWLKAGRVVELVADAGRAVADAGRAGIEELKSRTR